LNNIQPCRMWLHMHTSFTVLSAHIVYQAHIDTETAQQ
jgi:hypothetical protein